MSSEWPRPYGGAPTEPERARSVCEDAWGAHKHEIDERVRVFQGIPPIEAISYEDLTNAYYTTGSVLGRCLATHTQILLSKKG